MKLYRNLSEAVIDSLHLIFEENKYADKVVEKTLKKNPKWGSRDRKFIAETIYDIVRWRRYLTTASEASQNEYWKVLGAWLLWKKIELPPWKEFEGLHAEQVRSNFKNQNYPFNILESIPDWMDDWGAKELGTRWHTEMRALNKEAPVVLRTNTLKGSSGSIQKKLNEEGIVTGVLNELPDALILDQRQNVFRSQAFKDGLFEVQDGGSQMIAPFLRVEPGMRVIDACAGAGGKTLHLSALMQNKGRIIAMDSEGWKLDELKKRARRAGATNIETKVIESSKTIKRLAGTADRLLLDVPCSGMGVLRRNPDAKWKLSPEFVEKVKNLQAKILLDYSVMVKPGGMMVYSTCSIFPSENEMQLKRFLDSNDQFEKVDERHTWPSEGFDGFYMALIKKK